MPTPCTRRILALALLFAACAAMSAGASAASVAAPPQLQPPRASAGLLQYRQQLAAAKKFVLEREHTKDEWTAANAILVAALADPRFARLGKVEQGEAYASAGWAAIRLSEFARARDLLARATQLNPADAGNWLWLAKLDVQLGHYDLAAAGLREYSGRGIELLDDEKDFIALLVHRADPASQARLDLLQTLFDKHWQPLPLGASDFWYQLALARVRRGEPEAARAVIARINSPAMLVRLRSDKRFDRLVDRQAAQFDVERATSQRVDAARVQVILHPDRLAYVVEVTRAMLADGMNEAVLDVTGRALAAIVAAPEAPPFVDTDEQTVWMMNNRSTAMYRLGRTDEAMALLEQSAKSTVHGRVNVNQVLNLSQFYCGLGRADDAVATATKAGSSINDYGKLVQALAQHCAAVLNNDPQGAAQLLAQMRAQRKNGQITLLLALLRSDQMDEAARTVIELLASEADRDQVLYYMQDFLEPKPLPANVAVDARWQALLVRDDVRQALERVGRIEHYEVFDY